MLLVRGSNPVSVSVEAFNSLLDIDSPGGPPSVHVSLSGDFAHAGCLEEFLNDKQLGVFKVDTKLVAQVAHSGFQLQFVLFILAVLSQRIKERVKLRFKRTGSLFDDSRRVVSVMNVLVRGLFALLVCLCVYRGRVVQKPLGLCRVGETIQAEWQYRVG
jgi:hypothetical protein